MKPVSRNARMIAAIVDCLRERREALGMSKKKLAELGGMTRTAIILMERHERRPSLELLLGIAHGLNIPLSRIIGEAEQRVGKQNRT